MQLFLFVAPITNLAIPATVEQEARNKLRVFLEEHPLLPSYEDWQCYICGKVAKGIYSMPPV